MKIEMPKEILNFYRELVSFQKKQQPLVKVDLENINIDKRIKEGNSMLAPGANIEFKIGEFKEVITQTINITQEYRPEAKEELERIKNAIVSIPTEELKTLIHTFIMEQKLTLDEKIQKEIDPQISNELLSFLVINSIKPFVKKIADGLKDWEGLENWTYGYCPVCGWQPLMGKVVDDHKRVLHCSLCDFEWSFKRLKCIECGTENHENLQCFTVSGEEGREVHLCDQCKSYLKVVNSKELMLEKDMILEDVQTIYLDLLAEKEGYHKN